MTEPIARFAYQEVADDLRDQIARGDLAVGEPIPSTAQLVEKYEVSSTVARRAVEELRGQGLLVGRSGKAVYVRATPAAAAEETATMEGLAREVRDLRQQVDQLQAGVSADEVADLRRLVGVIHTHLIDLYGRLGQPYPYDGLPSDDRQPASRRSTGS